MARSIVTALGILMLAAAGSAGEIPKPAASPAVVAPVAPSPFTQLSPGNRRIATALFEAQKPSGPTVERLTLDDIARDRRSGKSWSEIFRSMKSQGLIQAESLSQVLGRHDRARHSRTYSKTS
jgi:hypothetical protein